MCAIKPNKTSFAMSHILGMATVCVMLAFATMGTAQARPVNYKHYQFQPGYAGPVYSSPSSGATWRFVPGRGLVGESCEMPTSACPNDERVTG
jgi:hypothetical protein